MSAKGSEIIVESLENHRVPYIFGIPGAKIDGVFDVYRLPGAKESAEPRMRKMK